ncbi:alpha-ketoglutaric semialdehyde dehydrogenase GucD [Paenibacillus contaminans]|uniref:Aldehyde dehydrogenase family protein n=1 Tax=Paenibacillus contaminans TaxID=450362 RepID=A0A329MDG9_9BACL|nr:alpha-ketoglutaric semialdehyde dehydrogenase GucD [Paenibacillus contaminans]RAV17728.1 aldehyde dehydrogenase family protein [Paenibacillus contaminans]
MIDQPDLEQEKLPTTYLNYIDGVWQASGTGRLLRNVNPADTRETVGFVQESDAEDVNAAVRAAKQTFGAWKRLSGMQRAAYLIKAADLLDERKADIAQTMTREMGKTYAEAFAETARGTAILRYYAGEGLRKTGDVIPSGESTNLLFTTRVPLGVVGVITPWNFPVAIPLWKLVPALVYGNTVVLKPAAETGITAAKIVEAFADAGFPPGVINMVTGSGTGVGQALVEHPDVQAITFTGSNNVGKRIGISALSRGAKVQLEMGGKNPVIVTEHADLDQAAELTIAGAMRSTGQKCTATSRVIVLSRIYEPFLERLVERIKRIKIGNGMDADTWMGPLAGKAQLERVLGFIQKGKEEGARLLIGGGQPQGECFANGYFVEPTLFDEVRSEMTIAQEEIFGPVLVLMKADTLKEAIQLANDVRFGLSASLFSKNLSETMIFIQEIEAGLVRINGESAGVELQAPFGGMKQSSSHSREQGQAAIEFFTAVKTVTMSG